MTDNTADNETLTPAAEPCELIGIGAALVDALLDVEDAFLSEHVSGDKGGMEMVDSTDVQDALVAKSGHAASRAAGGAAANTTVGCANLGINAGFIGGIGNDDIGAFFSSELERQNCRPLLRRKSELGTGQVLSMITPDAERTMRTYLGASMLMSPADLKVEDFAGAKVAMVEGYSLFNPEYSRPRRPAAKSHSISQVLKS
jgi:sugar/nucleoside kinase (ribokinase family)